MLKLIIKVWLFFGIIISVFLFWVFLDDIKNWISNIFVNWNLKRKKKLLKKWKINRRIK